MRRFIIRAAKLRWAVLLPCLFLLLSVIMTTIGQARIERIIQYSLERRGSLFEAPSEFLAHERFIDYAINAPAWVAATTMHGRVELFRYLPQPIRAVLVGRTMRAESDWYYFLFVAIMWTFFGVLIDRAFEPGRARRTTFARVVVAACPMVYGVFVYRAASHYWPLYPAPWFFYSVRTWGLMLILIGVGIALRSPVSRWAQIQLDLGHRR